MLHETAVCNGEAVWGCFAQAGWAHKLDRSSFSSSMNVFVRESLVLANQEFWESL